MFKAKFIVGGLAALLGVAGLTRVTYRMIVGAPINAQDYGADATGTNDSSAAIQAAITAAAANGKPVYLPAGTYLANVTITSNNIWLRGDGRRTTFLKPFANSPVVTIDSTAGTRQSNMLTDLGFDATGRSSTSPALLIQGTNINDYIKVQRFYMNGFTKSVSITGRCIWCDFTNGEITGDLSVEAAFDVNTSAAVNHMTIQDVRVGSGAGDGFLFNATGGQVFKTIKFFHADPEANAGAGIHLTNVDASEIDTCYIENNLFGVKIDGTFSRAVNVRGSLIWGTTQGTAYYNHATQATGKVEGNFLDSTAAPLTTLDIATTSADSHLVIDGNFDTATSSGTTKIHTIATDGNGNTHVSWVSPVGFEYNSESGVPATVARKNMLRMTNAGAVTINNLTGGDIGQRLLVWQAGSGTTTLTSNAGGAGQLILPGNKTTVLSLNDAQDFFYDGAAWRAMSSPAGPLFLKPDGYLVKHKRAAVGCSTAAAVGATCTSGTQTWTTAFVDANYSMSCVLEGPTAVPVVSSIARIAASFTITISALTAAAATGSYHCIAIHD